MYVYIRWLMTDYTSENRKIFQIMENFKMLV